MLHEMQLRVYLSYHLLQHQMQWRKLEHSEWITLSEIFVWILFIQLKVVTLFNDKKKTRKTVISYCRNAAARPSKIPREGSRSKSITISSTYRSERVENKHAGSSNLRNDQTKKTSTNINCGNTNIIGWYRVFRKQLNAKVLQMFVCCL